MNESPAPSLLDKKYVYQNNTTGAVSAAPLTTRQLVKLLCPASGVVLQHISPETQVLGVKEDGTYDETGWKAANSLPIMQEACAQWYYSHDGTQEGPYSCRQLFELLESNTISKSTKVWSSHLTEWLSIQDMPNLSAALIAFTALPTITSDANNTVSNYNPSSMTFTKDNDGTSQQQQQVQDELQAFLHSTAHLGPQHDDDDEDDEGYVSDNGTPYIKDPRTGNWIHADLAPPSTTTSYNNNMKREVPAKQQAQSKKRKKPKFSAKNAKCWIYLQGLPHDTNEEELCKFCSKVGIIELDPETQRPKIKLYRDKASRKLKGDASICYARPESVELALQLLDEAPYRPDKSVTDYKISVSRAKFEQHGDKYEKKQVSNAKRKVAKLAALQAIGWDEGDNGRITGGRKGLRIIVLKHMFTLDELKHNEDALLQKLEHEIRQECEQWGTVEKITVFSKNAEGVVIVKFTQPTAASTAVTEFNGRQHNGRRLECIFWDGVTDYTVRDEEKEKKETEKRQEEFGQWLDNQDIPEELRLQTEQ